MSSDISKAEKLAAARKKVSVFFVTGFHMINFKAKFYFFQLQLKEFQSQQKNKDNVTFAPQPVGYTIPPNANRSTPEFVPVLILYFNHNNVVLDILSIIYPVTLIILVNSPTNSFTLLIFSHLLITDSRTTQYHLQFQCHYS